MKEEDLLLAVVCGVCFRLFSILQDTLTAYGLMVPFLLAVLEALGILIIIEREETKT
jgi:hypothetical protein